MLLEGFRRPLAISLDLERNRQLCGFVGIQGALESEPIILEIALFRRLPEPLANLSLDAGLVRHGDGRRHRLEGFVLGSQALDLPAQTL